MRSRKGLRLLVATALVAGVTLGASGSVVTTASAAGVNQCAGSGPELPMWPAPLGTTGLSGWSLQVNGLVACASPLDLQTPFTLQLTCPAAVGGQCAGVVAFTLWLGVVPCTGVAVQSGFDFTGSCVAMSFNFDYGPDMWAMLITVA